jgi:predicted alpha/beta-fold hydrolase
MSDGGTISIDWAYPPEGLEPKDHTKVCFVFPGLSGGSERGYVKSLVRHMSLDKGYIVGVFHNRGVGMTEYTSPAFADLSSSEEINSAFEYMKKKFGNR